MSIPPPVVHASPAVQICIFFKYYNREIVIVLQSVENGIALPKTLKLLTTHSADVLLWIGYINSISIHLHLIPCTDLRSRRHPSVHRSCVTCSVLTAPKRNAKPIFCLSIWAKERNIYLLSSGGQQATLNHRPAAWVVVPWQSRPGGMQLGYYLEDWSDKWKFIHQRNCNFHNRNFSNTNRRAKTTTRHIRGDTTHNISWWL